MNPKLALLGGLSADTFMKRHWQRTPLLVRRALAVDTCPIDQSLLFGMAAKPEVESRLVQRRGRTWALTQGPIKRRAMPPVKQPGWTLLVQGVDLHHDAAHALLQPFNFVPAARLDDVMVSFASDGGGVGAHTDEYDVFLLQLAGQRRWRVGPAGAPRWRRDVPLKQLQNFKPTHDWVLGPGDMLYVPPGWGHDGVAVGSCITASIGFRSPQARELAREMLSRLVDDEALFDAPSARYRDPRAGACANPGAIPAAMARFASQSVLAAVRDSDAMALALGEWLTEPKASVTFEPEAASPARRLQGGLKLDRRTRMLYDGRWLFINGEAFDASGDDAKILTALADKRSLSAATVRALTPTAQKAVLEWVAAGWVHSHPQRSALSHHR